MEKRKLEELNLIDDFLFGKMMTYPEIGEQFARELLRIIFNKNFERLTVIPQKVYYGNDTEKHGARLDVYLEESIDPEGVMKSGSVYDIEPEKDDRKKSVENLPKRVRFYHAVIDTAALDSGKDYHALKNVIVIMITPFDPFGENQIMYTIRNVCVEVPDMPYDDGARTLFLYTRGEKGNVTDELRQFLKYMEQTKEENASTEALQDMQKMVHRVKQDKGVSLEYMKIFEREQMLMEIGEERGFEKGMKQGIEQGKQLEHDRAEREKQRADAAESENTRLKELLAQYQMVQS